METPCAGSVVDEGVANHSCTDYLWCDEIGMLQTNSGYVYQKLM